jgi:hypothetical protein
MHFWAYSGQCQPYLTDPAGTQPSVLGIPPFKLLSCKVADVSDWIASALSVGNSLV